LNGHVDEFNRALFEIQIVDSSHRHLKNITAWIDTAFTGHLVFSNMLIDELGLEQEATTEAILADGAQVTLASYICRIEWFGKIVLAQVIANDGQFPLLGTELLNGCVLKVDYTNRVVELVQS
jgi:clan AA aspartic protease